MKINRLLCILSFVLSFNNLFSHHLDTLVTLSPAIDYGRFMETATFPGGTEALSEWIAAEINYPILAGEEAVEGEIIVSFEVGSDGQVFDVLIEEGIDECCNEEAIRVVKSLPKWCPARFGEMPICMRMKLSLAF